MTYPDSLADVSPALSARPDVSYDYPDDASIVTAISQGRMIKDDLYRRFRRPILQVFLQRRIDSDVAQDLLQRTFLQAIKKIRTEGLDDPTNLGGYLYRTACNLAIEYWRGETSRRQDPDEEALTTLTDDALSLEERLDHELLAKSVRELMRHLSIDRDREVLQRFYLQEEPKASICESLALTDLQFNQVLWRARQRFRDIVCKHAYSLVG